MTQAPIARRLTIRGRVQGVWYRAWTVKTATGLGLVGWVRNRRDGSVEALIQGVPQAVEEMVAACRQGPPAARVNDVTAEPVEIEAITGFEQTASV